MLDQQQPSRGTVLKRALALLAALAALAWPLQASAADFREVAQVLENRCLSCHDSATGEGRIDLTPLLQKDHSSYGKYTKLWVTLDDKITRGEMPPADHEPLEMEEKQIVNRWFYESFVLRDGKSHIGRTPLRRLTRYELENTLEDLLAVQLKPPYRDTITGQIDRSRIQMIVPSDLPGKSGFANDAHRMETLKPPLKEITEAVSFVLNKFRESPASQRIVFGQADLPMELGEAEVKTLITSFAWRAYRGHPEQLPDYAKMYYARFLEHLQVSNDATESLLHVIEMMLVSPEFLYRIESSKDQKTPYPVRGVELATRLSYFLWSTTPDEELLQRGADGSLLNEDVLKSQVDRMLNSPKRIALAENFAGQWLGFDDLMSNDDYFLNERWNRETYDEALFFFDELIKSGKSILDLIDSDWIYKRATALGAPRHGYTQIEQDPSTDSYVDIFASRQSKSKEKKSRYDPPVLVQTPKKREGGIITSPAIMRITASKSRTSPIRRGVWVLKTVIGKELGSPPDVPSLEEARQTLAINSNPTVADVIKLHVSKQECVSCHKVIDPLGLGLENYASNGTWRTRYRDKTPVESAGVMPNGEKFETPWEMKKILLETYKDDIAANFVKRLFAYALGRKLEPFDRVSLQRIMQQVKADRYKVNTAIEQIILSEQFRNRQDG